MTRAHHRNDDLCTEVTALTEGERKRDRSSQSDALGQSAVNQTPLGKEKKPLINNVISNQDVVNNVIIRTDRLIDPQVLLSFI